MLCVRVSPLVQGVARIGQNAIVRVSLATVGSDLDKMC
jgi:hypothetical protein